MLSTAGLTTVQLSDLVARIAEHPDSWLPRLRLPARGQRWWTRLPSDPTVDLWLLSWLPGLATDLHDHGPSAAALTVVRGILTEIRVDPGGRQVGISRATGSTTSLAAGVIHDVRGAGDEPAVSIHAYSPPLTRMNYYEPTARGGLRVSHTVDGREPEWEPSR